MVLAWEQRGRVSSGRATQRRKKAEGRSPFARAKSQNQVARHFNSRGKLQMEGRVGGISAERG